MGFENLFAKKKLIIVCGVGGVGKTTLSASLALKAARLGKKSLVITVDPAKRLAAILGLQPSCVEPELVWKEKGSLFACLLNAKHTFDSIIQKHADRGVQEMVFANPLYQHLSLMIAGTHEYMAMEKLYTLSEENQFDLIVVDTPPAKQATDFLTAPIKMINMLNDSMLRWLVSPTLKMGRVSSKILAALSHLSGAEILEEIAQLMQTSLSLLDGFTKRSEAVQKILSSKACSFALATNLPNLFLGDIFQIQEEWNRLGLELETLLLNRISPSFGTPKEIQNALEWAKQKEDPLWEKAAKNLQKNDSLQKLQSEKIKPFLEAFPYHALIPEQSKGVSSFNDLQKLTDWIC